jgi:WXG100 family type VII secretion target
MSKIQADYEQLEQVANLFQQQADQTEELLRALQSRTESLENGGWMGKAANDFSVEMNDLVFPAVGRLQTALLEGSQVTKKVIQTFKDADEETKGFFRAQ